MTIKEAKTLVPHKSVIRWLEYHSLDKCFYYYQDIVTQKYNPKSILFAVDTESLSLSKVTLLKDTTTIFNCNDIENVHRGFIKKH